MPRPRADRLLQDIPQGCQPDGLLQRRDRDGRLQMQENSRVRVTTPEPLGRRRAYRLAACLPASLLKTDLSLKTSATSK